MLFGTPRLIPMIIRALVLLSLVVTAACPRFSREPPVSASVVSPPPAERLASRLGAGDVFEVRVVQEPELSGLFRVGAEGDVDFPFCGRVSVEGLHAAEVVQRLRDCLRRGYLRDPQVTVLEREYNSKKIMVFGHVQQPGAFVFENEMSVVHAITLAGGFSPFAQRNRVVVTRVDNGRSSNHRVPVEDIGLGAAPDFFLRPGDTVFVPESAL